MSDSENTVALVTGASRGIGRACAEQLAMAGCSVIGTATTSTGAKSISAFLSGNNTAGRGMKLDVNDADGVTALVEAVNEEFGAPLILVNNAGKTRDNILLRMKEEEWEEIMTTNLRSVFRMSKAVLRGMTKARQGRIINITSVVGVSGNAGQANYAAAKAGIIGFGKSLAQEIGSRGITVNSIAPGFIETDMTRSLSEEQVEKLIAAIPTGRLGQPEDIARAVVFLASAGASYINGATLHVNGGLYMT